MKGGVLEVLLVKANGLKHSHFIGSPGMYTIVQCGTETFKGKIAAGKDKRVWWNEKFVFSYASPEWQSLTRLTVRIMKKDKFREDIFVGEAIVHLEGVVEEGRQKGCIELKPTPYNVVLSDGTYEGQVKIGLKFTPNVEVEAETGRKEQAITDEVRRRGLYRTILDFALGRIPWPRFSFLPRFASWQGRPGDRANNLNHAVAGQVTW